MKANNGYKYIKKSDETFVYDGKDKSAWYLLIAEKGIVLTKNRLDYINDPAELVRRSTEPVAPPHVPYHGPMPEPPQHKEARMHLMRRMDKDYEWAKSQWMKDVRQIEADFGIAITILMEHVSEEIKKDLHAELAEAGRRGEDNQQKYNSLWNKLMADYGPYSQQDIENMRKEVNEIDMDGLGVKEAIQKFKEAILSMTMTPVRDGNGHIVFAPAEVNHAAIPARPVVGAPAYEMAAYMEALLQQEAIVAAHPGPMLTHAPNDAQVKTYLINMLQRSQLTDFHKIYVESLKPANHGWTHQHIMTDIEALIRHGKHGIDLGGPGSKAKNTRFIGVLREARSESGREDTGKRHHKRSHSEDSRYSDAVSDAYNSTVCTNCKGNHEVRDCTSTKCGHCGRRFESVRERKSHWGLVHANDQSKKRSGSSNSSSYSSKKRSSSPYPKRSSSSSGKRYGGYHSDASSRSGRSNQSRDYYRDRSGGSKGKKSSHGSSSSSNRRYKVHAATDKGSDADSVHSQSTHGSHHSHQKH